MKNLDRKGEINRDYSKRTNLFLNLVHEVFKRFLIIIRVDINFSVGKNDPVLLKNYAFYCTGNLGGHAGSGPKISG